jgi:hypothetical protein
MLRARRFRYLGSRVENRPGCRTVRTPYPASLGSVMPQGTVKWFNAENQHVEFEVTQGPKGLQATHVRAA